jgi:wyosine [tRNA(Phe)-imidazoG37] synthetase (radical SAM superfamily)
LSSSPLPSLPFPLTAGAKVCNMNCAYCQYGWTRGPIRYSGHIRGWPTPEAVEMAISERLTRASTANEVIDRITIAGHGEPTLHPEFKEIVTRLCAARDRIAAGMPIAILSNSTTAGWEDVRRGLALLDERYMKLDAGDSVTYARINGGGRSIAAIIDALRTSSPIVVQSMFVADQTPRDRQLGRRRRFDMAVRARDRAARARPHLHRRSRAGARLVDGGPAAPAA